MIQQTSELKIRKNGNPKAKAKENEAQNKRNPELKDYFSIIRNVI